MSSYLELCCKGGKLLFLGGCFCMFGVFFKLCKMNLLHLSDIRPRNKYRMQIVTFPRTNTRGKLTKKSCVCSTWKQTSYDTVFTYSFRRLVAPSSPGSEVSVHKHHFCHVVAGAPHIGSRGRYHHSALPHSFSLRQMWAQLFRSRAGKWTKQTNKKKVLSFLLCKYFSFIHSTCLAANWQTSLLLMQSGAYRARKALVIRLVLRKQKIFIWQLVCVTGAGGILLVFRAAITGRVKQPH